MPITVNNGGVLRTLETISVNDSGVLRKLGTVSANDGGVLRTIFSMKKVEISGITPLVVAEDHIVIVNSGTFTLSLPKGARIILGSGGYRSEGGFVAAYTLTSAVKNAVCEATVAAANIRSKDATKLVIGSNTYGCGSVEQIIQSKWGPIGGRGGFGSFSNYTDCEEDDSHGAGDGTGAGGGGAGYISLSAEYRGRGGNYGGYGNYGGNTGRNGSSGAVGPGGGGGGGGGYAAGGGESSGYEDEEGRSTLDNGGNPGAGIIVIEW